METQEGVGKEQSIVGRELSTLVQAVSDLKETAICLEGRLSLVLGELPLEKDAEPPCVEPAVELARVIGQQADGIRMVVKKLDSIQSRLGI